ncbi:MAG: hypothetical protein FJ100_14710 [Deltaproteobacteria bacterium]|nr:hypothetical protein [Deltaproteobacteria bacterium]
MPWFRCSAVVALVALVGVACATKALRRMFSPCAADGECETSQCYEGQCSASCSTNAQCGAGVCIEKHCLAVGTACSDHDACTASDKVTAQGCVGTPIHCGDDNLCQQIVCDPTIGCGAKAKNVGLKCGDSPLTLCGSGGLETGGCKCSVWQASAIGPFDPLALKDGKPVAIDVGDLHLRGLHAGDNSVVQVGRARKAPTDPWRAWLASSNLTAQLQWSVALPPVDVTATSDQLDAVARAGDRWLLAGLSGDHALVAGVVGAQGTGSFSGYHPLRIGIGTAAAPATTGAALDGSGSFAVVGHGGGSAFLVRGKMDASAGFAAPQVQVFSHPDAKGADTAKLMGIAPHPQGWLAAGGVMLAGQQQFWLAYTEGGFGGTVASSTLAVPGAKSGQFAGILRDGAVWLGWGTAVTTSNKVQCAVVALNADRSVAWQMFLAPDAKPEADPALAVAMAPLDPGRYLMVATIGNKGSPWAVRIDGKTALAQPIGTFTRIAAAAVSGTGTLVGGDQGDRAVVQRIGPKGETACPK